MLIINLLQKNPSGTGHSHKASLGGAAAHADTDESAVDDHSQQGKNNIVFYAEKMDTERCEWLL